MADYINDILDEYETILNANLATELAVIDANLEAISNNFMFKSRRAFKLKYPMLEVFPFGEATIDPHLQQGLLDFNWRIVTVISISANDEGKAQLQMGQHLTAVIKTIEKGTVANNEFKLNGVVDSCAPIGIGFVAEGERATLLMAGIVIWEVLKKEDPLT